MHTVLKYYEYLQEYYLLKGLLHTGGDSDTSYPRKLSSVVNSEAINEENFDSSKRDLDSSIR